MEGGILLKRKHVILDDETLAMLEKLDGKMNLKSNHTAVIILAIKRLYHEEISQGFGKRP